MWLNTEPCGLFAAGCVWALIIFSSIVVTLHVLSPSFGLASLAGASHALLFNGVAVLALLSHARTMLSNPGAVPPNARPVEPSGWGSMCFKCNAIKPARAHHCSSCNACIVKMDHHCPWVNNCVGLANQKYFLLFIGYTATLCGYALGLVGWHLYECVSSAGGPLTGGGPPPPPLSCAPHAGQALVLIVAVIAVLFGMFTCCMFAEQVTVLRTSQTTIDRYTRGVGGRSAAPPPPGASDVWASLGETFGGNPGKDGWRWDWLLPTAIVYPDPEALTGYCFRDTPRPRSTLEEECV